MHEYFIMAVSSGYLLWIMEIHVHIWNSPFPLRGQISPQTLSSLISTNTPQMASMCCATHYWFETSWLSCWGKEEEKESEILRGILLGEIKLISELTVDNTNVYVT